MVKIFIPLPKKENINLYLKQDFEGFFIGIDGFSENFNNLVNPNELKEYIDIIKKSNKRIFIYLNRLYFNDEIDKVKDFIKSILSFNITGIAFCDVGILNILNDINHDKEILWIGNHLGTNSNTLNFLNKRNVAYSLLSTEITAEEIINIKKNTSMKVGVILYGYLNMATSSRKLLTNYFEYIDKEKNKDKYIIKDKVKNKDYFLVEKKNTNFFTNSVLNGLLFMPELIKNNIDFIVLDDYMLDENKFYNVLEAFSSLRNAPEDDNYINELNEVVITNTDNDTFNGFLDKKTVYKVKDYE